MHEHAILTELLTKTFGHFTAVDSLNVSVEKGELFGLLGPNGAGKTTTVRMLCTLIEPTRGTANIVGYDIREQAAEVRRQIGVVSEGVSLYKDLTIEENLKLLGTLYEIPRAKAEARIRELMDMFAFREKATRRVGALSTGWAKKAMICAALLHSPQVLFLDEVTSGLDPQSAIQERTAAPVYRELHECHESNRDLSMPMSQAGLEVGVQPRMESQELGGRP